MIEIAKFREQGYLYDSLENYTDLFSFEDFKEIKSFIDSNDIKRYSRYDYWFKYDDLSYIEQLHYDTYLLRDKDLNTADKMFALAHRYQIKKMQEDGILPTWVFGTNCNTEIINKINNRVLSKFQKNFVEKYYSEKNYTDFENDFRLQFYDEGCEIKLHDDGKSEKRICVFLYFLNNEWSTDNGGRLIVYDKNNEPIPINPVFPNFAVLDSDVNLFHEVEKVLKDTKYNIVCFYSYK
jgi:Rps23 Pro-64 3,4-dihydroxylase Tpa1-like proline 4-hydroxylase